MKALLIFLGLLAFAAADPSVALVRKYGWEIVGKPTVIHMDVPENLNGLPFHHYQSASKAIGLDLTPAQGKKIALTTYTLTRKTKSGANLYAHVAMLNKKIVGAWLSTDAPVAPGIQPLSDKKMGSNW